MTNLQQKRNSKLSYRCSTIRRNVWYSNTFLGRVLVVNNIIACSQHTNEFHRRTGVNDSCIDRSFVSKNNLCVIYPANNFDFIIHWCTVIYCQFAKLLQRFPRKISRIFRICIQNNNLHNISFFSAFVPLGIWKQFFHKDRYIIWAEENNLFLSNLNPESKYTNSKLQKTDYLFGQ